MAEKINIGNEQYTYEFAPMFEQQIEKYMEQKNRQLPPIIDTGDYAACEEPKNTTDPIPWEDIPKWKEYFLSAKSHQKTKLRDYTYFMLAINTGRRCGDLISLKIGDVLDSDGNIKDHLIIQEQKTHKASKTLIHPEVKKILLEYLKSMDVIDLSGWLFPAPRKRQADGTPDHIPYITMEKMMTRAEERLQTGVHIGTHSLRKTLVNHWLNETEEGHEYNTIVMARDFYLHEDISTTLNYIGNSQRVIDQNIKDINFNF